MVRSDWYVKSVLEVRIGWESLARTHIWPFMDVLLLGNLMNVGDEIELIAQRVFDSLSIHVNKMNWAIYNSYLLK